MHARWQDCTTSHLLRRHVWQQSDMLSCISKEYGVGTGLLRCGGLCSPHACCNILCKRQRHEQGESPPVERGVTTHMHAWAILLPWPVQADSALTVQGQCSRNIQGQRALGVPTQHSITHPLCQEEEYKPSKVQQNQTTPVASSNEYLHNGAVSVHPEPIKSRDADHNITQWTLPHAGSAANLCTGNCS